MSTYHRQPARLRRNRLLSVILTLLLCGMTALGAATPARAQNGGGENDVTFWDDTGNPGDAADVPTPATAAADGFVYLNPNGGRTTDDGMFVIVGPGNYHIIRDRDWQFYDPYWDTGQMEWVVFADGACFTYSSCNINGSKRFDEIPDYDEVSWDSTVTLTQDGPTTWKARLVNTAEHNGRTYTLTVDTTYTPPGNDVQHTATLEITPDDPEGEIQLYLGSDMYLDSGDYGPGYVGGFMGDAMTAQSNAASAFGITSDGSGYTSLFEGYYACVFTYNPSYCGVFTSSDPAAYPDVDDDPDAWFGPGLGRPYPMDPPIVNGGEEGNDSDDIDAGIGMHWNLTTARTINAAFWLGTLEEFDAGTKTDLPTPELTEEGFPAEDKVVTPPAE